MREINCYFPITLRITGRLTDAQLDQLGDELTRALAARISFAERTINNGRLVSGERVIEQTYERANLSRLTALGYEVSVYDRHGERQRIPVHRAGDSSVESLGTAESQSDLLLLSDYHDYAFFFAGGAYGHVAESFIREFFPSHHRFQARSFEQMFHLLARDIRHRNRRSGRRIHIGEIIIVTHANAAGGMKIPLTQDGRRRTFTPWDLAELQQEFRRGLHRRFRAERREVVAALDENTRIVVRGCNFGQSQAGLDALRAFFGGPPLVFAPRGYQGFEILRVGGRLLRVPEDAFDFLVRQGYLPADQLELSAEEKRRYIRSVFGTHPSIPADFFLMSEEDYQQFKKLPSAQRLGPEAEPLVRRPSEESEPEEFAGLPSGGRFWSFSSPPSLGRDPELDMLSIDAIVELSRRLNNPYRPENAAMLLRLKGAWERKSLTIVEKRDDPLAKLPPSEIFGDTETLAMDAARYPGAVPRYDIFEEEPLTYRAPATSEQRAQASQFEEVERIVEETAAASLPEVHEGSFSSRGQVETLPDGIRLWNFSVAGARLRREFHAPLEEIVRQTLADPTLRIKVDGHTSSSGSDRSNERLSQQRAEAVRGFLISAGVPEGRIEARGLGERSLIEPRERRRDGQIILRHMARNRRVEVRLEHAASPPPPQPAPEERAHAPEPPPRFRNFRIRTIAGGEGGWVGGGGVLTYEIEELGPGGRNSYITFIGGGITGGLPAGGYGISTWTEFTTTVPMRLEDFEGGGRIAAGGVYPIGVPIGGGGYSVLVFYCGDLPTQKVEGWGWGIGLAAGASWYHGWWELRD